jgi:hypothetical protein
MFRAWKHYFWVLKLWKWLHNKTIHSTPLVPKLFLLCFGSECTISGHRCCKYGFAQNACILLHWTKNNGLDCFRAFQKPSHVNDTKNFCFGHECTILGTEVGKMFSHQMHPSYCFGPKMTFASVLKHSLNVKRCKTCVSGVNALFRGTEIAKIILHQMHSF